MRTLSPATRISLSAVKSQECTSRLMRPRADLPDSPASYVIGSRTGGPSRSPRTYRHPNTTNHGNGGGAFKYSSCPLLGRPAIPFPDRHLEGAGIIRATEVVRTFSHLTAMCTSCHSRGYPGCSISPSSLTGRDTRRSKGPTRRRPSRRAGSRRDGRPPRTGGIRLQSYRKPPGPPTSQCRPGHI